MPRAKWHNPGGLAQYVIEVTKLARDKNETNQDVLLDITQLRVRKRGGVHTDKLEANRCRSGNAHADERYLRMSSLGHCEKSAQ